MNSRLIMDQAMGRVQARASLISKVLTCLLKDNCPPWTVVHIIQSFAFRNPIRFPGPVFQLQLVSERNARRLKTMESDIKFSSLEGNQYIKLQKGKLYLIQNEKHGSHTEVRMETTWSGVTLKAHTLKQRAMSNFFSFLESRQNRTIIGDGQAIQDIQAISGLPSLAKLRAIQQSNSTLLKVMERPMIWMKIDNLSVLYVDSLNCGMTHFRMVYQSGPGWLIKNNQALTVWVKQEGLSRRPKLIKFKQEKQPAHPGQGGCAREHRYTEHRLQDWRIDQVYEQLGTS